MSTKKKDNTTGEMILEKKETQADIQARMETGKIEIMKVVEGIPGAEKLAELIERGKKKGKLSSSELLDVLEDMELGTDQMDKIYDTLENLGIDTVGEDYMPELADTAEPPVEEMEEITEEEIVDPNSLRGGGGAGPGHDRRQRRPGAAGRAEGFGGGDPRGAAPRAGEDHQKR